MHGTPHEQRMANLCSFYYRYTAITDAQDPTRTEDGKPVLRSCLCVVLKTPLFTIDCTKTKYFSYADENRRTLYK